VEEYTDQSFMAGLPVKDEQSIAGHPAEVIYCQSEAVANDFQSNSWTWSVGVLYVDSRSAGQRMVFARGEFNKNHMERVLDASRVDINWGPSVENEKKNS